MSESKENKEFHKFPEYQDNLNLKSLPTESQVISDLNNYTNPTLKASEILFDETKMIVNPVQYAEPKYIKEKQIYEERKKVIKEVVQLQPKNKKKVKTVKTIINKPIVISENEDLDKFLKENKFFNQVEVPIPTKSTIQNLLEESLISSQNSWQLNNSQKSNNSKINKSNESGAFIEKTEIISKNPSIVNNTKNNKETYFPDEQIPKPTIYEGDKVKNFEGKSSLKNNGNNNYIEDKYNSVNKKSIENNINNSIKSSNNKTSNINESHNNNKNSVKHGNISIKSNNNIEINNNIKKESINSNNNINNDNNNFSKKESKNILNELPEDQTEILSKDPSIEISQIKDPNYFEKSPTQSVSHSNKQNQSNHNSQTHQSKIKQQSIENSKVKKSYLTYQQSYIKGNQSQITSNPRINYSEVFNNGNSNSQKPTSESISLNQTKNKPLNINGREIATVTKIENQSSSYQKSIQNSYMKNSNIKNTKSSKINNSNMKHSNINNTNSYDLNNNKPPSFQQSNINQSNELLYSNIKSNNKKSGNEDISQNSDNMNKINNNSNAYKYERSSFPTKSYPGKINSKEILPINPFGEENYSFKKSNSTIKDNPQIK